MTTPAALRAEIERCVRLVRRDTEALDLAAWRASRDANDRLLACIAALAPLVRDGDERARLDRIRGEHLAIRERLLAELLRLEADAPPRAGDRD